MPGNERRICNNSRPYPFQPESKEAGEMYTGKVVKNYDRSMSHFFKRYKKLAFAESSLTSGDQVLVFCCGTGLDFPYILERIGKDGRIVGIDLSSEMLGKAQEKIDKSGWQNVELINADITEFTNQLNRKFDAGVCTLGISIIPRYKQAYDNLCSNVRERGEIILGDMQLASGMFSIFNPLTIFLSKKYGGTYEGHKNSLELQSIMEKELTDVRKREFFLRSYFYCIGKTH